MRTRDLKPGFFRNEELAQLHPFARLLYQGMWCMADKRGRLKDSIGLIKSDIFPHESVPVEKHLTALAEAGFIVRYEAGNVRCIWIPTFLQHQHPHPKEPESTLPPAPDDPAPDHVPATDSTRKGRVITGDIPSNHQPLTTNTLTTNDLTTNHQPPDGVDAVAASFARFGKVTSGTPDAIEYSVKDYTLDWVQRAVKAASGAGFDDRPAWSYVESILERWKKQGGPDDDKPRLQAAGRANGRSARGTSADDVTESWERYAAGEG